MQRLTAGELREWAEGRVSADSNCGNAGSGLMADFDGTLAQIAQRPPDAVPVQGAEAALVHVAKVFGKVAVVSGRPAAFLVSRLGNAVSESTSDLTLYGMYGMERISRTGEIQIVDEAKAYQEVVSKAVEWSAERLRVLGLTSKVFMEDKGLSFTLHWRQHPYVGDLAQQFAEEAATKWGLVVRLAKMSAECVPPVGMGKADAVREFTSGLDSAVYIGDDLGDISAYEELDRFSASGGKALKVVVLGEETPGELVEQADRVVDGPNEVVSLLAAV